MNRKTRWWVVGDVEEACIDLGPDTPYAHGYDPAHAGRYCDRARSVSEAIRKHEARLNMAWRARAAIAKATA